MDYKARLAELEKKVETVGLTEQEAQEVALIHSMSLQSAKENIEALLDELRRVRALKH
jgi:uncharacterized protein YnzC (UPF0291/DUF896 family)